MTTSELRHYVRGSSIVTVVPLPLSLSIDRVPPCAAAIRRAIASPSPVPSGFVENNENQSFWWLPNVIALEAR